MVKIIISTWTICDRNLMRSQKSITNTYLTSNTINQMGVFTIQAISFYAQQVEWMQGRMKTKKKHLFFPSSLPFLCVNRLWTVNNENALTDTEKVIFMRLRNITFSCITRWQSDYWWMWYVFSSGLLSIANRNHSQQAPQKGILWHTYVRMERARERTRQPIHLCMYVVWCVEIRKQRCRRRRRHEQMGIV